MAACVAVAAASLYAPAALAGPTLDRGGLRPTFADEFTAFSWDERYHEIGPQRGLWRTAYQNGWDLNDINNRTLPGNGEQQVYVDKAFPQPGHMSFGIHPYEIVDGEVLRITANKAAPSVRRHAWGRRYTSGMITTWGSFSQRYGVFEIRARTPKGKGLWSAFWLLNQEGGQPPEIDVFEILGHTPNVIYTGIGSNKYTGDRHPGFNEAHEVADTSADFHTYTLDWGPKHVVYYFDGQEVWRQPTPPDMNKPMYMIVNLAVGGHWPGAPDAATAFPAHLDIDWVRAWQRPEYAR